MITTLNNCKLADGQITNIVIENGIIKSIGRAQAADQTIDIKNNLVIPGVIDTHVHFREPGGEHKEDWLTGSRAAVSGGVTTVIDMPNNNPPVIDQASLDIKKQLAKKSLCNYGFFIGATTDNIEDLRSVTNTAGIKIYVGSSTGTLLVDKDKDIEKIFGLKDKIFALHAEDEDVIKINLDKYSNDNNPAVHSKIRNPLAAAKALGRMIDLAKKTDARIHICHISTKEEIAIIKKAKDQGINITCEVSPHHLFLNQTAYQNQDNFVKVNPPLRSDDNNSVLWQAIKLGIIDTIATDHAPHTIDEKQQPYNEAPAGIPEVETSLPLLLNQVNIGNLELSKLIELTSKNPAALFNIKNKGLIQPGYDADLTVVDMSLKRNIQKKYLYTKCGWSPYEGWELTGWPVMTFVNGHLTYNNGKINDKYKGKEIKYGKI
ncbi:MAG: dihydroorotase [bacterium]|nr:dihydroorotase [bacterium]